MKGFEGLNPRRISYDFDIDGKGASKDVKNRVGGNGRRAREREDAKVERVANLETPRYQKPSNPQKRYALNSRESVPHQPVATESAPVEAPLPLVKKVEVPAPQKSVESSEKSTAQSVSRVEAVKAPDCVEVEYKNKKFIVNAELATMATWSFMKSLSGRKFVDASPFAEQLAVAMHELGTTSVMSLRELEEAAHALPNRDRKVATKLVCVLQPKFGDSVELEMTQTEVKEFLLQAFASVKQPNLLNRKKAPVPMRESVEAEKLQIPLDPIPEIEEIKIPETKKAEVPAASNRIAAAVALVRSKMLKKQGIDSDESPALPVPAAQKIESPAPLRSVEADVDVSQKVNPYNLPKSTKERIGSEMHTLQDASPDTDNAPEVVVQAEAHQNTPESPQTLEGAMSLIANEPAVLPTISEVGEVEPISESVAGVAVESLPPQNKNENIPSPGKKGSLKNETPEGVRDTEVASIFQLEFGITNKELESIEGFANLSLPQQKMVFENLIQSTYGRVQEETVAQYTNEKDAKRERAVASYGKIAGNAWAGIRAVFTKDFNLLKTEQRIADSIKKGGIEEHRTMLEQLTQSMATFGPRVHEDAKTGELLVDLVHIEFDRENRKAEYDAVSKLNFAAHRFAKIPAAWREPTLGVDAVQANEWKVTQVFKEYFSEERKQQLLYKESSAAFAEARSVLESTLRESGKDDAEIATVLLGIDTRVQQLQFMQASPDAVAELAEIKAKNIYYETAKSMVGKSGLGYVALGYIGRTATAGVLGWFAAPLVSSGIAASRSWTKTAAELRERDRNARMGTMDVSDTALNIVSAESLITKTTTLLDRYHMLSEQIIARETNGEDVTALKAARHTTLDRLSERAAYIRDKQNLNRVNYGARNGFVGTQVNLYKVLGEATTVVENCALPDNESLVMKIKHLSALGQDSVVERGQLYRREEVAKRLNRFTAYKETAIEGRRRVYRYQELATQSLKAGGFALAGSFLAEYYRDVLGSKVRLPMGSAGAAVTESAPIVDVPVAPTESVAVPHAPSYTIERGDTLTKIFKEHIPEIKELENSNDKAAAIAKLLKTFSGDELERIGVKHGNANLIYAGDTINLDELNKIIASKRSVIEEFVAGATSNSEEIAALENKISTLKNEIASIEREEFSEQSKVSAVREPGMYEVNGGVQKIEDVTDLLLREKAEIAQEYLKKNIFGDRNWNLYKNDLAIKYVHMQQSKNPIEQTLARLFTGVSELPIKLVPQNNDTIASFLERVSIVIAQEKDSGKIPVKLLSIFQKIEQSDRFT